MPEGDQYWLNTGGHKPIIHMAACNLCRDGKGIVSSVSHIANGWYGFYATYGAAVDAAHSKGYKEASIGECCRYLSPFS